MSRYKVTAELCKAELDLIEATIKVLQCERAMWLLSECALKKGKDVYVKGKRHKIVEKGAPIPIEFLVPGRFIDRQEIEKMLFEKEVPVIFFNEMLKEFDEGNFVLYDDETQGFRIFRRDQSVPAF